jgi:hypothetical protein
MLHSLWLPEITIRPGKVRIGKAIPIPPLADLCDDKVFRDALQKVHGLDPWEVHLVSIFLKKGWRSQAKNSQDKLRELSSLELVPFKVFVRDLASVNNEDLNFNIGFALGKFSSKEQVPWILYFRIQNHVRKMGLAHEVLHCMLKHSNRLQNGVLVAPVSENPEGHEVRASELEAIPSVDAVEKFRKLFDSVKFRQGPIIGQ